MASTRAAGCRGGESKRAIQTVTPLADHLGIEVDTHYQQGDEAHLAKEIRELRCTTLVCWHHENIHKIVEHLGPVTPEPPHSWPDDRFDLVWTFTNTADGWRFAQVPQLMQKHKAKNIEFKVVIKGGKAVLKAVPHS